MTPGAGPAGGEPVRHPESRFRLGDRGRTGTPYRPTYPYEGAFLDEEHRRLSEAPQNGRLIDLGIPGWLRREDALKLYEMAYFATGDVLELGTYHGLSTSIIAGALRAAGRGLGVLSVELREAMTERAQEALAARGLAENVRLVTADAGPVLDRLVGERVRFAFAFVDHSHAYEPMLRACNRLPFVVSPGGFVLFHDYTDRRNTRRHGVGENPEEYGVYAAIEDGLSPDAFEFFGCYGCCGLFRRLAD